MGVGLMDGPRRHLWEAAYGAPPLTWTEAAAAAPGGGGGGRTCQSSPDRLVRSSPSLITSEAREALATFKKVARAKLDQAKRKQRDLVQLLNDLSQNGRASGPEGRGDCFGSTRGKGETVDAFRPLGYAPSGRGYAASG